MCSTWRAQPRFHERRLARRGGIGSPVAQNRGAATQRQRSAGMDIVQGDQQPISESSSVREGTLRKTHLLAGTEGSPGNFRFGLGHQIGDFYSPRHHHNFDQWRFQLEGIATFDKNGTMSPGTLGLFPRGRILRSAGLERSRHLRRGAIRRSERFGYLSKEPVYAAAHDAARVRPLRDGRVPSRPRRRAGARRDAEEDARQLPSDAGSSRANGR